MTRWLLWIVAVVRLQVITGDFDTSAGLVAHAQVSLLTSEAIRYAKQTSAAVSAGFVLRNDSLGENSSLREFLWPQISTASSFISYVYAGFEDDTYMDYSSNGTLYAKKYGITIAKLKACKAHNISEYCTKIYTVDTSDGSEDEVRDFYSLRATTRPWYSAGLNGPAWTAPYQYFSDDVIGFDAVTPLYSSVGHFMGVAGVSTMLETLSITLVGLLGDRDLLVYIVEYPSLELMAASQKNLILNSTTNARIVATESSDKRIAVSSADLSAAGFQNGQVLVRDGYFMSSLDFEDSFGLNWRIITVEEGNCEFDTYIGSDNITCYPCYEDGTTSRGGASRQCSVCSSHHFETASGECAECATGFDCSSIGSKLSGLTVFPGYYRFSTTSQVAYECTTDNCLGGNTTDDFYCCKPGAVGPLCSYCEYEFHLIPQDGTLACIACEKSAVAKTFGILFGCILVCCLIAGCIYHKRELLIKYKYRIARWAELYSPRFTGALPPIPSPCFPLPFYSLICSRALPRSMRWPWLHVLVVPCASPPPPPPCPAGAIQLSGSSCRPSHSSERILWVLSAQMGQTMHHILRFLIRFLSSIWTLPIISTLTAYTPMVFASITLPSSYFKRYCHW